MRYCSVNLISLELMRVAPGYFQTHRDLAVSVLAGVSP